MASSIFVVYDGDARLPVQPDVKHIPGLPPFPLGEPVEISEDYINRELHKENVQEWGDYLFSPHGVQNANLPIPQFRLVEKPTPPPPDLPTDESNTDGA